MKDFALKIDNGEIAVRNYGGTGKDILMVHGTGHNLEVWKPLADLLTRFYRVWAFDTRGHGQTTLNSEDSLSYWKDIEKIIQELGIKPYLMIGHSTGGFSISAYVAWQNSTIPIVILDGFVLDKYTAISEDHPSQIPAELLWNLFRYGWEATREEKDIYIKNKIAERKKEENFNLGIPEEILESFLNRSFYPMCDFWLRRPTMGEVETVGKIDAKQAILPDVNLYDKIKGPIAFIVAHKGFYFHRKDEILKISSSKKNRLYVEIEANHNLHMIKPTEIKNVILDFVKHFESVQ